MTGWQWHQLDHLQIICTALQTDNHASTSSLNFYRPDALPDTQPTTVKAPTAAESDFVAVWVIKTLPMAHIYCNIMTKQPDLAN